MQLASTVDRGNAFNELLQRIDQAVGRAVAAIGASRVLDEVDAIDQFHGEEALVVVDEQLIEADEIRMRHIGQDPELLLQPKQVGGTAPAEGFERDGFVAKGVVHVVDHAHPAGAQASDDAEPIGPPEVPLIARGGEQTERMLQKRAGLAVSVKQPHHVGTKDSVAGTRVIEIRLARRRDHRQGLVEDRPQTAMTVWTGAHALDLDRAMTTRQARGRLYFRNQTRRGMSQEQSGRITTLLGELRKGSTAARDELVTLVYPELRQIAARYIRQERPDHTLRTTGLVNEMDVRLFGTTPVDWQSRAHFFAAVAREMRHILVDYARARDAQKRPDQRLRISLSDLAATPIEVDEEVVALDEALSRLETIDVRASRVVELRYFTGLSERETAEALEISISTMKRDWNFAKAWLFDHLRAGNEDPA